MNEVTRILSAIAQGDPSAASQFLPLVYDEVRQLAAQKLSLETPGQTLQPTVLVVVSAGGDGFVRLWEVDSQRQLAELLHGGTAYQLAFSPDGATLATTGKQDGLVKRRDVSFLRSLNLPGQKN